MRTQALARPGRSACLAVAALALLALAPAAHALPRPAIYFLHDAALPDGTPPSPVSGVPLAPGELITLAPPGLPPANTSDPASLPATAMQTKAPETRTIQPAQDLILPVMFNSNRSANTGRIYGPVIALLFLPDTPLVQHGNVTVQLVVVPKDASPTALPPAGEVIASNSIDMDAGNTTMLPNATGMAPPNPTDPQGSLGYVQGQLLAYGFQELAGSYKVLFLLDSKGGLVIDKAVDAESTVQLRLSLSAGSSPLPVAVAAGQPLAYWNFLTPSFVYVPWYAADPPRATPTHTASPTASGAPPGSSGHDGGSGAPGSGTTTKKKTPGIEVPLLTLGLAALVLAARRRLR